MSFKIKKDITGFQNGTIIAIKPVGINKDRLVLWLMKCDCGEYRISPGRDLTRKRIRYCSRYCSLEFSNSNNSILYYRWIGMRERCYNPKSIRFNRYGGRGIKIYEEWKKDYIKFKTYCYALFPNLDLLLDQGCEIDRINNDKDYCPGNIRIVEPTVNANNRSTTNKYFYNGKMLTHRDLLDLSDKSLNIDSLSRRLLKGWDIDKAINTPVKKQNKVHKIKDISGKKVGKLVAKNFSKMVDGRSYWIYQCECGNEKEIRTDCVKPGNNTSCGCEKLKKNQTSVPCGDF